MRSNAASWPPFDALFKKVGASLSDGDNIIYVIGHYGPHPEEYHQYIYDNLYTAAQSGLAAFQSELQELGRECATPGTYLNSLLTKNLY